MPTREEIREGIAIWLYNHEMSGKRGTWTLWLDLSESDKYAFRSYAHTLSLKLEKLGVVIAVEGELPEIPQKLEPPFSKDDERIYAHYWAGYENCKNDMRKAGFDKKTIPLIESDSKGIDGKPYIVGESGAGSATTPLVEG